MTMSSDFICKTDPNIRPQPTRYEADFQQLRAQRDELAAALREAVDFFDTYGYPVRAEKQVSAIRAALASVEGKANG